MAKTRFKKYQSSIPRERRDANSLDKEFFAGLVRGRGARSPYYSEAQARITEDSAMGLTGVYSAVNRISSDFAMIPLQVWRKQPDGSRVLVEDHPVNQVLKYTWDGGQTNSFYSKRQAMGYCLGWGQSIGVIEIDRRSGAVTGIQHHHPRYATARRDSEGKLYYQVQGINNQVRNYYPDQVLHFKNYACNADNGDSPIVLNAPALALYASAEAHAQSSHSNGGNMRGFFMTDQEMTTTEVEDYLAAVAAEHSGAENANKYGVLQGGMKWVASTFSPEATQLLASRTFSIQDVGRIFSLPNHKLNELSRSSFSNIEEQNRDYLATTLMSWLAMWKAECNLKLFSAVERAAGLCVEFDTEVFIQGNSLVQAQVAKEMLACGAVNRNEVRAKIGLGPIKGGDAYIVQSNQGTLEQIINGDFVGKGSQPVGGESDV